MSSIFVDTGAFVALVDRRDRRHRLARRFLRLLARTSRPLVTSNYVVDEALTLVRVRVGHAQAVQLGERLLKSSWCRVLEVGEDVQTAAWELFVRYDDQVFSFTDCTSFALMRSMGLADAFTFDRSDYAAAGFTARP